MNDHSPLKPPPGARIQTPIRNTVRALLIHQNRVLLLRKRWPDGSERFSLPGGGQEIGEALHETLLRECFEEIGAQVEIVGLAHVANSYRLRDAKESLYRQHVEFIFRCKLPAAYQPTTGSQPDKYQVGVEWVGLHRLDDIELRPGGLKRVIRGAALGNMQTYLPAL
ncbi:NUDIX domain-containing protein [Thiosocius teredinicola]|uniref:NUDIX domain-containing protein n=1 Tax=Thiosocius teredinicola TaxID=1973002 RepID=UPI0013DE60D2